MTAWIVLLAVAGGTYALRASMFLLLGARTLPPWTERPMSLVAPAALAALVGSMVMTQHGAVQVLPLPELLAVVAVFLAVRRSGNVMHAFTVGMPVLWTTTWALG